MIITNYQLVQARRRHMSAIFELFVAYDITVKFRARDSPIADVAPEMTEDMDIDSRSSDSGDIPEEDAFEAFDDMEEGSEDSERSMEKDDTEEELEKLVFGDTAGFRQEIKTWKSTGEDLVVQDEDALDNVNDSEVCLICLHVASVAPC